jgi:hypothetical protein
MLVPGGNIRQSGYRFGAMPQGNLLIKLDVGAAG